MTTIEFKITIEAESEAKAKEIGNALYTLLMRASNKDDIIFLAKKVNANPKLIQQAKLFLGSK